MSPTYVSSLSQLVKPRVRPPSPENYVTAAKRDFLLFQIVREDRNGENLYYRSVTPIKALIIHHLNHIVALQDIVQQRLDRESSLCPRKSPINIRSSPVRAYRYAIPARSRLGLKDLSVVGDAISIILKLTRVKH